MPTPMDMDGTPFVFAAWLTGNHQGVPLGRIIDRDPFETTPSYGMEDAEILLPGAPDVGRGCVILADRASFCTVMGQDGFYVEGGSWSIGFAENEGDALSLVKRNVQPGEWPDLRMEREISDSQPSSLDEI